MRGLVCVVIALISVGGTAQARLQTRAEQRTGRLDRGWQVRSEARRHIHQPPSTYQRRLYYDCITSSEAALRFLIDQVGVDRVVLGSDWPFVQWEPSPVTWVQGLQSLTLEEKAKILWENLEQLLGL